MALSSISFVLFTFILTVLSSPVSISQASSTAPPAVPSNPITFGALTAPSLGGVFDDFKLAAPPVHPDNEAAQVPQHVENRFLRPNSFRQKKPNASRRTRRASPASATIGTGCPPGIACFKARDEPNTPTNVKARASLADILSNEPPCPTGVACFKVTEKPSQGGDEA